MTQFFSSTFWALTVFDIHFCNWKILIFVFIGSFLWSILVCKILEYWRWMLWVTEYAWVTLLKLNKLVNADLKHLVKWLNANKISLNVKQTEMVIFKSKQNKFEGDLKIRLCCKRLCPTESFKYLRVKIDASLSWQCQVYDLSIKLNRAKKHASPKILRFIYFAIFKSHLSTALLSGLRILELFNGLWFYKKGLFELLISNLKKLQYQSLI